MPRQPEDDRISQISNRQLTLASYIYVKF